MLEPVFKEEFNKIITTFIKHYYEKSGCSGVIIGLSGGLDSTVVVKLAADSLGSDKVLGILMPETATPVTNMKEIDIFAEEIGVETRNIDITDLVDLFQDSLSQSEEKTLGNLKARIRMIILFQYANSENRLVLGTSNKSEMLTGYFTKYGDGAADICPIGDLYKTQVRELARHIGVPDHFIDKTPSGDLWEGQEDEVELGISYEQLDKILLGIELGLNDEEISERTELNVEKVNHVESLVQKNIHKRRLGLIPKLGIRTVGLDWREH